MEADTTLLAPYVWNVIDCTLHTLLEPSLWQKVMDYGRERPTVFTI